MFWDKYLALFLQDPDLPPVSKNRAKRMLLRCNGKLPNEINVLVPFSVDERKAMDYLSIVNLNEVPHSIMNNPAEYLQTFWVYLQKADNTKAKDVVLSALQQAMVNIPPPMPQMAPGQPNPM